MEPRDWEGHWRDNMSSMNAVSTVAYWNKRAEDYDDFIRTSRFSYGIEIVSILLQEKMFEETSHVFEIAGGVGALTLPLCRYAAQVTTVEPAEKMAEKLRINADEQKLDNVEIVVATCQDVAHKGLAQTYDLAIMCHATWQFPDLKWLIQFMERAGNGKVCIADSIPEENAERSALYLRLGVTHHAFDRVLGLRKVLLSLGRTPKVTSFPYVMRRSMQSARAMMTNVVGKYHEPRQEDLELIDQHVAAHSSDGVYIEPGRMGVVWWER